ncbi:MAG: hypothetical protein ACO1NQ_06035 [Flavobacteriales bacterium]
MVRSFMTACYGLLMWACSAQTAVDPIGPLDLPAGAWADTVFIAFDTRQPLGVRPGSGAYLPEYLLLREHPATVLKRLFGDGLAKDPRAERLFLKVNRLHVDEVDGYSTCDMHAEVLRGADGRFTRLYESPEHVRTDRKWADARTHGANVVAVVQAFLNGFQTAAESGQLTDVPVPPAQLSVPLPITSQEAPILVVDRPKRGLYRTFMQMRMDQPDSLFAFELSPVPDEMAKNNTVYVNGMPKAAVEAYWGLSDGTHAYVRVGQDFVRLDPHLGGFEARIHLWSQPDPATAFAVGLTFGMLGVAILFASWDQPAGHLLVDLDMLCGELIPRSALLQEPPSALHIITYKGTSKGDGPIIIEVPGSVPITLRRGQWTSARLPLQLEPVHIVVEGPLGRSTIQASTATINTEIHVASLTEEGGLGVAKLRENERLTVLHALKEEDRVLP